MCSLVSMDASPTRTVSWCLLRSCLTKAQAMASTPWWVAMVMTSSTLTLTTASTKMMSLAPSLQAPVLVGRAEVTWLVVADLPLVVSSVASTVDLGQAVTADSVVLRPLVVQAA